MRADLHGVRLVAEEAAAGGEVRAVVLALERDVEVLKKRMSGSLAAALGVDAAALAGAARQSDVTSLAAAVENKLSRSEAQVRCSHAGHMLARATAGSLGDLGVTRLVACTPQR